jgi:phospholipase C
VSSIPAVSQHLNKNFPQFDLGIPDQWRVDLWLQDFQKDVNAGTVPALSILWVMCDHTGGPPTAQAEQADNDLAVGRIIDYISHSPVWSSSAIFIEEDDAQNGLTMSTATAVRATSSVHTRCKTGLPTTPITPRST